ncbi:MAG: hypothetical protein D6688_06430 [Alphaproteobacteria bacterium]|nr:MAG: hypothetical protein D6688_06430 [Alphaproteobacteria bacterium]
MRLSGKTNRAAAAGATEQRAGIAPRPDALVPVAGRHPEGLERSGKLRDARVAPDVGRQA